MDGERCRGWHLTMTGCEVGGYLVVARRTDSWDAIVAVLVALDAEHHDCFHRVMRGCRRLSNSGPEVDGLDDLLTDSEQVMFDLAFDREQRREQQGYVTPAQARAFLQMSRQVRLGARHHAARQSGRPRIFPSHRLERRRRRGERIAPLADGIRRTVRAGELRRCGRRHRRRASRRRRPPAAASRAARRTAGPRAASRAHPGAHAVRRDRDHAAFSMREPGARLSGEHDRGRMFHPGTALHGAGGVGRGRRDLQPWPGELAASLAPANARRGPSVVEAGAALPDDFLVGHDLVSVFQVGWTVLHNDVCMDTAERLIGVLTRLRCDDRETQAGLDALRIEMTRQWQAGAPWRARDALDVIAILDMPAWAALLGLIDECPVIHAGIGASQGSRTRAISATAFEFISENSQIASVREFMRSLPETLRG